MKTVRPAARGSRSGADGPDEVESVDSKIVPGGDPVWDCSSAKMFTNAGKRWLLSGLLLVASLFRDLDGAELRLRWVSAPAPAQPKIQLSADPGPIYAIERSTNLTDWLPVVSGSITNGTLDLLNVDLAGATSAFYRGRVVDATNGLTLVEATVDLMQIASTLVTPEAGGTCTLTNDTGVIITFTVGPSNVVETVPVVMTLVKELKGLPETEAPPVAVRFQPDDYWFLGEGTLEFLFPTNLNMLAMSSFGFDNDGSELHLLSDTVETNRVRLRLSHFSGKATAPWTGAGRTQMRNRKVNHPVKAVEHTFGSALAEVRQALGEGKTPSGSPAEVALRLAETAWDDLILPRLAEAANSCSTAVQIAHAAFTINWELRSHGVEFTPYEDIRSEGRPAVWICNCVREAEALCNTGDLAGGKRKIRDAITIRLNTDVTYDELGACVADPKKSLYDQGPCAKPGWSGTLVVKEYNDTGYDFDDDSRGYHEHWAIRNNYTFEARVLSSEKTYENDEWPGDVDWKLHLSGKVTASHAKDERVDQNLNCTETTKRKARGELEATSVPFVGTVLLHIRSFKLDYFEAYYPDVTIDSNYDYSDVYDRSSLICLVTKPEPYYDTGVEKSSLPDIEFIISKPGTSTTTTFEQADTKGVRATGFVEIPEREKYYSGGRHSAVKLELVYVK